MSITLALNDITLLDQPLTKQQAIALIAEKMIAAGLVKDDYTQAMFDRDAQISTFLGNGIAIPHGTTEKRNSVYQTGLKILYSSQGILWDDEDNIAYVVIGIAAQSNEHLDILRQLTRVVIDESAFTRIKAVKIKSDLLSILTGQPPEQTESEPTVTIADREFTIQIYNPHGLHTRPASILAKETKSFESEIQVANPEGNNTFVNAKSVMKLVSLGVKSMQKIKFIITGPDAVAAEERIRQVINDGLGEDISHIKL